MADLDNRLLDVVGKLMIQMNGTSLHVEGLGDVIVVELPGLGAGLSILRAWPGWRHRREILRQIHHKLSRAGLTLHVNVGPRTVGVIGSRARGRVLSRLLGMDSVELRIGGLLGSVRRHANREIR